MNFVTYNNIRLKCYINFLYMAPQSSGCSPILARAIDNFYCVFSELKKISNYLFSSMYFCINWVTISFTVVFCFNATILNSVLKFSSISITNCFCVLILITTFVWVYINICKLAYKYIFIGI